MLETVRLAFGRPARRGIHYECRDCGTALDGAKATCPACESTEVAVFEL
ncbi:MAG: hypothetical protein R3324_20110 [Halobacteriales archaeon]|nr:hypothetical protein [Halobacteriales archaeon]